MMKTALIVIDLINDIVHPEGKIASLAEHVRERQVIAKANQALQIARQQGWLTVLITVGFSESYKEQPKESPIFGQAHTAGVLTLGHWGTAFHDDLEVSPEDLVIVKQRISPFYGTSLEAALRANKIDRLVVCGVGTPWAIQSVVREGHDRDYQMVILEDACAADTMEEHHASLLQLNHLARVIEVTGLGQLAGGA